MRTRYAFLAVLALGASVACEKAETRVSETGLQEAVNFTFNGSLGAFETKTAIDEAADGHASVLWKATDQVSVFDAEGNNCLFEATAAGATTTLRGTLVPSSDGTYYAVYPYAEGNTVSGTTVTTTLPSEQTVAAPGFADGVVVSAATASDRSFSFSNLASLVRFTVPSSVTALRSVRLESMGGTALAGTFTVSFAGTTPTVASTSGGTDAVTVAKGDGTALEAGNYYAAVLPGSHQLKVTLTDLDGRTAVRQMDAPQSFVSSHIRSIGTVKDDTFYQDVEFVLGSAAVDSETAKTVYTGSLPAGTYAVSMLFPDGYAHRGDKAIYAISPDFSFTVEDRDGIQTIAVAKEDLTARHLLVRSGDNLQDALDAAEAGLDDIYVGAGTFTGNFTMKEDIDVTGSWNDDFTSTVTYEPLKSTGGLTTILDGNAAGRVVNQAADFEQVTTWKNVVIRNGSTDTGAGAYLRKNGVLDGCEVAENTSTGDGAGFIGLNFSTVTRCYIHGNVAGGSGGGGITRYVVSYSVVDGNQAKGSGGLYVYAGGYSGESVERPRIFNCKITNNKAVNDNGGGVRANRGSNNPLPILYNLLVAGNTATGWAGSGILVNAGCVYNCTVIVNYTSATQDNANAICNQTNYSTDTEKGRIQNCISYGNWTAGKAADTATQIYMNSTGGLRNNSTSANGMWAAKSAYQYVTGKDVTEQFFTDFAGGDYTLSAAATCGANGTLNGLSGLWPILPKTDLDGNNRLNADGTIGRGCYLFQH